MKKLCCLVLVCVVLSGCSYHRAFVRTDVGVIEAKTLPAAKVLKTAGSGDYHDKANELFRRLFGYIDTHNVPMTVPVQGGLDRAYMIFFLDEESAGRNLEDEGEVHVVQRPEQTVVSLGCRGAYIKKNTAAAEQKLRAWLAGQTKYKAAGPAYGVFWNGPFAPGVLKRFEVHIPVEAIDGDKGPEPE